MIPEITDANASSLAVPAGSTAEGTVARGGTPSPPRADEPAAPTPRADGPVAPLPRVDGTAAPKSPSQVAATTPPVTPTGEVLPHVEGVPGERPSKKQRTQDTIHELTQLVKTVLDGMAGMNDTMNQSNEAQRRLQTEVH